MKLNKLPLNVIGLNRVGLNQIGSPSHRANTSARPYIDPEVLASLVAVCICDGKSNNDPDRAVIKNLVDPDNPFVISNAAYKLNSGYGKYEEDFTDTTRWEVVSGVNKKPYELQVTTAWNPKIDWIALIKGSGDLKSVSLNVSGIPNEGTLFFYYGTDSIQLYNGNNKVTLSGAIPQTTSGYRIIKGRDLDWSNLVITQIPSHQGALVTDGVDDLIVSQKTSLEMIGGDNRPFTVISMISVINNSRTYYNNMVGTTNMNLSVVNSTVLGKTGIFGYTSTELNTNPSVVNNILGDKNDYSTRLEGASSPVDRRFSVTGYLRDGTPTNVSSIAWYWTFIANKALTTDQINQVISYFNLDKHVKPDIIYDTIRQDITNENHASFNDELTDFSGNGHNMKIYNSAWNKESGINDEGAWQADGVTDYGQYIGDLGLQDYTIAVDRAYVEAKPSQVSIMSNVVDGSTNTPFLMEHMGINKILAPHSFGKYTALSELNINRFISYQSTYKYNRNNLDRGTSTNTGSGLTIGRIGGVASQYANIALWSLLLFPYTLSEFLLERQLKRYKLGTLYPDMVEFRPVISGNIPYNAIEISQGSTTLYNKSINKTGIYLQEGSTVRVYIQPSGIDEVSKITVNGVEYTDLPINPNGFYYADFPIAKSPQKISYAIDEYIRYEDIVQPYPAIINLKQDGKTITWGDKLKVGSDIVFAGSANLLPELYTVSETRYNGVTLYPNTIIKVEKSMVFDNARTYLKANEPSCILSPNRLRIPNSSYKILGYIPDLTGKGNHGVINNSAYVGMSGANGYVYNWNTWRISKSGITSTITDNSLHITSLKGQYNPNQALFEPNTVANTGDKSNFKVNITGLTSDMKCTFNNAGSIMKELINGVNEISVDLVAGWYGFMITTLDGSVIGDCDITIQQIGQYEGSFCLDGVDDYITIPTLAHGGKCMLMKVNWNKDALMLYDQRMDNNPNSFAIYIPNFNNNEDSIAYSSRNDGKTYIDGVLNTSVKGSQLKDVTHNITITNSNPNNYNITSPVIGSNAKHNAFYAQMALFDFMLFPEISSEDEIKELNEVMGIENNIEVS